MKSVKEFKFERGSFAKQLTVARMEAMRRAIIASKPAATHDGVLITETPDGWVATVKVEPAGGSFRHPFQLVEAKENDVTGIKIRYGTVNSDVPKFGEEALSVSIGDSPFIPIDEDAEIWLKITLAENTQAVETISIETSKPEIPEAEELTTAIIMLGEVKIEDGEISAIGNAVTASLSLASCGTSHFFGSV